MRRPLWRQTSSVAMRLLPSPTPLPLQRAFATKAYNTPYPGDTYLWKVSDQVLEFAQRENIGFPSDMRAVKTKHLSAKPTGLRVLVSKQHIFSPWHMKYFDTNGHPLCEAFLKRALEKQAEPLWYHVELFTPPTLLNSGFVRNTMRIRVRRALRQALLNRGYDAAGRRLPDGAAPRERAAGGEGGGRGREASGHLYGSIKVVGPITQVLELRFEDLVTYWEQVLPMLEKSFLGNGSESPPSRQMVEDPETLTWRRI